MKTPMKPRHQSIGVSNEMLPRQIVSIDQVPPGTWIATEAMGSISITLGAQVGYDFNWVREARLGGLTGDIGLRLQMGVNAAVGFYVSGKASTLHEGGKLAEESIDSKKALAALENLKRLSHQ